MKRRNFLKAMGLGAIGGCLSSIPRLQLFAAHDNYAGPLWITVEARGGWDPTSFCDPKGYSSTTTIPVNDYPSTAIIKSIGNFEIAPPPDSFLIGAPLYDSTLYTAKAFFQTHMQKLLVINGIDSQTNSHSDGQRHNWSGELARKGYPNFGALVAGVLANNKALPFVTNGGYSVGGGLVTPVRIDNRGLTALLEVAYPGRSQNIPNSSSRTYYSPEVSDLIAQASASRLDTKISNARLLRVKASMENLRSTQSSAPDLALLADALEATPIRPISDFNGRTRARNVYLQARIAMAAYKTGATAAAHIALGGFDTHSNHDANHYPRLMDLLQGISAIVEEANSNNLADRIVIIMGSDFGRTNKYNDDNGKDHWPVTSMMFMGNSQQVIRGNRVIGKTTSVHKTINIDPVTLIADTNGTNPSAVRLTPAHIHRALRTLANVDFAQASQSFDLKGTDIDLFS